MDSNTHSNQAPQRVIPTRRKYNTWVVDESIEDYALRYAPQSVRKWSLWTVTNTALAAVSFLAMEALGATMLWQYGFSNAFGGTCCCLNHYFFDQLAYWLLCC